MQPFVPDFATHDDKAARLKVMTAGGMAHARELHHDTGTNADDRHRFDAFGVAVLVRTYALPRKILVDQSAVGKAIQMPIARQPPYTRQYGVAW